MTLFASLSALFITSYHSVLQLMIVAMGNASYPFQMLSLIDMHIDPKTWIELNARLA